MLALAREDPRLHARPRGEVREHCRADARLDAHPLPLQHDAHAQEAGHARRQLGLGQDGHPQRRCCKRLDEDQWIYCPIAYNSFTISFDVQAMLEAPLEKKTGTIFGPPGTKKLIYFIDDFNMPSPDKYGTQSAIALLRQHKDYGGFYDLKTLRMKRSTTRSSSPR